MWFYVNVLMEAVSASYEGVTAVLIVLIGYKVFFNFYVLFEFP